MIRTIIAYDDNDAEFGEYFEDSHTDISTSFALNPQINNVSIRGLDCTEANIDSTITALNGGRFIFIALTHGNVEELVSHEVYVSVTNSARFNNSFVYSTACSTGKQLGPILIGNNCSTFIGYQEEVEVVMDYSAIFYQCENYGIKSFLSTDESIETSYNKMIACYNQEIDRLFTGTMEDVLAAAVLVNNRSSLIHLGNKTHTRADFH